MQRNLGPRAKVVLLSTYELGHQPFGLASPAAWLHEAGAQVTCNDLAIDPLDEEAIANADLVALYLPMHTATRLAINLIPRLKALNSKAHLCFYGLYAPMNEDYLRSLGADTIIGGEFESGLLALHERLSSNGHGPSLASQEEPVIGLAKQSFRIPEREGLPELDRYAHLVWPKDGRRTVGYTEATRGCKHLCRHCPVVPVYAGRFRVVQAEVVMEDIRRQIAKGARHITFGDPDFFNGVGHATRIVRALHAEFPEVTYDVTIKVEHLLKHASLLKMLAETGCLFVTTAAESVDDGMLERLDKGHSRADFVRAVGLARDTGLTLAPTFIPFTPWSSLQGYLDLLRLLVELDLVEQVAPVQLAIRLLLPKGSLLLDTTEIKRFIEGFDKAALSYRWSHPDPRVDRLQRTICALVEGGEAQGRREIFRGIWQSAHEACGVRAPMIAEGSGANGVPHLSEPWYCCAEPTEEQFARV
ncbi:MAG: CUAEP/CCAEP-tail radical SAM protein [Deltaproteobacteria bacterium]|nr:CUAEP/CCAEP-tail radical SAM protein [Deltaproteobacteria bacterium]